MRMLFIILMTQLILFMSTTLFAQTPETQESRDVLLPNISAGQCKSTMNSNASPDKMTTDTGMGQFDSTTGPGVSSCTGCSYRAGKTNTTVQGCYCDTCYTYFN